MTVARPDGDRRAARAAGRRSCQRHSLAVQRWIFENALQIRVHPPCWIALARVVRTCDREVAVKLTDRGDDCRRGSERLDIATNAVDGEAASSVMFE